MAAIDQANTKEHPIINWKEIMFNQPPPIIRKPDTAIGYPMHFDIKTIAKDAMRYETVGDYFEQGGTNVVRVANMGNRDYEFLVAIHEMIELWLCQKRGIDEPPIMAFDVAFEANRQPGNVDEPGDHPDAPYRREHRFAENIERLVAAELGVDWNEYTIAVETL